MTMKRKRNTSVQNRRTPKWLVDLIREAWAVEFIDVAADHENHVAHNYFTEETNGLTQEWGPVNFCNPPYENIKAWVLKGLEEARKGRWTFFVLPQNLETEWARYLLPLAETYLIWPRVHFIDPSNPTKRGQPGHATMICLVTPRTISNDSNDLNIHYLEARDPTIKRSKAAESILAGINDAIQWVRANG